MPRLTFYEWYSAVTIDEQDWSVEISSQIAQDIEDGAVPIQNWENIEIYYPPKTVVLSQGEEIIDGNI